MSARLPDFEVQPRQHLRLPPFGKDLMTLREQNMVPSNNLVIVSLDSWDYGKRYARVVVPADLDPAILNFAFVAGLDVFLVYDGARTTLERRDAVIRQLLRNRAATLRCLAMGDPCEWKWITSRGIGIELREFQ